MKVSKRVQNLFQSPMRKLAPLGEAAKARGVKVHHLNIGQPDVVTPPEFMQAVSAFDSKVIAYSESQGEKELRKAIQGYYANLGMDYAMDQIFVTSGGSEALLLTIMALCDPGDEILTPEPYYANYSLFAYMANATIRPLPTKAEEGFHLPSEEVMDQVVTPKTKAILLSHPGNPTGVVYTKEEMERLLKVAKRHGLVILSDEVYREFVYDGNYTSFGSLEGADDTVVLLDSISKRYSACGARVGAIMCKDATLRGELIKLCQARLCVSAITQRGAAALYNTPKSYLEEVRQEYNRRRDVLYRGLKEIPGVICEEPKGAFYMMVKLPIDDSDRFARWLLEEFQLDGETVMVAPGSAFYATEGRGNDEVRLTYVLKTEDLERAAKVLKAALEVYPGRTN